MTTHADLRLIQLLVVDVDGVLTDGTVAVNADGTDCKFFNSLDGHGIRLWKRAGLKVAFLSGRHSEAVKHRANELGVDFVHLDCHYKLPVLEQILEQSQLSWNQVACVGDDLPDLPIVKRAGFGAAVANAVDEVKQSADYVTTTAGGKGAVREVIEHVLKSTDRWHQLMKRYLA